MKGHYIGTLIDLLAERGFDREDFLRHCGLKNSDLSPDHLIDQERVYRVTQHAVALAQDQGIGLFAGQRLNINTHGALGYAAMASENLEHALQVLVRYYKVQAPRAHFALHKHQDTFQLICESSFELPETPWLTTEFLVTSVYTSMEFLLSGRLQGMEACFRFAPPPHADHYPQVFRIPVYFNQEFDGLRVPRALTQLPLPSADPVAASIFEKRCESMRREVETQLLSERITEMQKARNGDFLSQTEVAERLHLSVSTLHRKLGEEGSSYKNLMAEVKKELAIQHLQSGLLTIDEIAHVLGFSDASNFRRAFVGWTGQTPSDFRRS